MQRICDNKCVSYEHLNHRIISLFRMVPMQATVKVERKRKLISVDDGGFRWKNFGSEGDKLCLSSSSTIFGVLSKLLFQEGNKNIRSESSQVKAQLLSNIIAELA